MPLYIFTTFIVIYATQQLKLSRAMVLNLVMLMALLSCFTIPLNVSAGRRRANTLRLGQWLGIGL